jgi:DNA polymerase I-like protein with 3'-5' exonuclease and polymerase domains
MPPHFIRRLAIDTEFSAPDGYQPDPICIAWQDIDTGERGSIWLYNQKVPVPPFPIDDQTLIIAHSAPAEVGVFLQMGWSLPENVIDTLVEFRVETNGKADELGIRHFPDGLLDACTYLEVPTVTNSDDKKAMQDRCIATGPFTFEVQQKILKYCSEDVLETVGLFHALEPKIHNMDQALFRGEFQKCSAKITRRGIPVNWDLFDRFRNNWPDIQDRVSAEVNSEYRLPLFNGKSLNQKAFAKYLESQNIPWDRTESGLLVTKDDYLEEMSDIHPQIRRIREARDILSSMRLSNLAVGPDKRNRTEFWSFSTKTGRNAPKTKKFIFNQPAWMRGLVKPEKGRALLYCDYSQQEFLIAGVLSRDKNMIEAYTSGDAYMRYAIMIGVAPEGATKKTHPAVREQYKNFLLALQYGAGHVRVARSLGISPYEAQHMLQQHRNTFRRYWEWVDEVMLEASMNRVIKTSLGWQYRVVRPERISTNKKGEVQPKGYVSRRLTIQNWTTQSTGSDLLRVAVYLADKAGIEVVAMIHDAILVECDVDQVTEVSEKTLQVMGDASEVCLGPGNRVRAECEALVKYPDRYRDKRDVNTWEMMMKLLEEAEHENEIIK